MTSEEFISQLAAKLQAIGTLHGIGETWFSIDGSVPAGGVPFCGQTVTRALYTDLYTWAQSNGKVKTESEWQSYAAANGGNCPYYSDGDGSTTFRMPCVKAYLKGATSASNAGKYEAQALPNIKGSPIVGENNMQNLPTPTGAIYVSKTSNSYAGSADSDNQLLAFDASKYDPTYQDGADVTPETYTVLMGVYAVSIATNVGGTDVGTVLSKVSALETEVFRKSGDREMPSGYETLSVSSSAVTVNESSPDSIEATGAALISVANGTSGKTWCKTVGISNANATISLGSSWRWAGGSEATVEQYSILILKWQGTWGYASLQLTS